MALAQRVLAVAMEGGNHDWAAYIDAVPGESHRREWEAVYHDGSKLRRELAELIFPDFTDLKWRP